MSLKMYKHSLYLDLMIFGRVILWEWHSMMTTTKSVWLHCANVVQLIYMQYFGIVSKPFRIVNIQAELKYIQLHSA